ncbi:angiomotin-like protein 1 isoform X2 [Spea bombifrons]|nr:angiomotin-like protein 1 isoform X2 [Spea bombifrons]
MRGSEDVSSGTVLRRLIQERLRYGGPNENMNLLAIQHQATGSAGPANGAATTASSTENLAQEDPQMVNQSARQEPQGQEHQVDNAAMEKTLRAAQPQQNNEELPTYEEAKAQSQFFRGHQPGPVSPGFLVAEAVANHKSKTEGRPTVSRANSGQAHQDEALKELKQGHVRSMSERIMLSLERNGAKQNPPTSGSVRGLKSSSPSPSPSSGKGAELRGPPPDYPYKVKQAAAPVNKTPDREHFYREQQQQHTAAVQEAARTYQVPTLTRSEASALRYQTPPDYSGSSRQCQALPYSSAPQRHHSPMSSQASSASGSFHAAPAAVSSYPVASPSPSPQPPPDAFSHVDHAQQIVELLTQENSALRLHLQTCCQKADKLQKFEAEIEKISDAYESLVKSSAKRETLDKAMKTKLEGEIRRLHDFNRDLRDRLETANRQLANRDYNGHEDSSEEGHFSPKNKEHLREKERLERESSALRTTNEDQRRHIDILEQALNNAQAKVVKLEEELRMKQVYVEEVEKLQQALTQLQAAGEKREQLERRLRTRLETELKSLRAQQRQTNYQSSNMPEHNTPVLMDLLRKKEETILGLEADVTKWEQKYLEESAMRHFAMDAAATAAAQRDTTIISHSRNGSHNDSSLEVRSWHDEEEILQANRRFHDMEHTIKNLHAKIIEQDAMIKVLHQRSRKDQGKNDGSSLRPARSVPSIAGIAAAVPAASGSHSRQTSVSSNQAPEDKKEEKPRKGSAGLFQGREHHESPSPSLILPPPSFLLPPPAPTPPVTASHAKTGSKDNSTQTDKNPELFWPNSASFPGRGRVNMTPSSSPLLRHTANKGCDKLDNSPILGKTLDLKCRIGNTATKTEFPEPDNTMEVLI